MAGSVGSVAAVSTGAITSASFASGTTIPRCTLTDTAASLSNAISLQAGVAQSGSTGTSVLVGTTNFGGGNYVGQRLRNQTTGEVRVIASQSLNASVYTFGFGSSTGENGPFSAPPTVTPTPDTLVVCP